jgi:hypothetical protein
MDHTVPFARSGVFAQGISVGYGTASPGAGAEDATGVLIYSTSRLHAVCCVTNL